MLIFPNAHDKVTVIFLQLLSVAEEAESIYNKVEYEIRKYSHIPSSHFKAFIQLDWEIYNNVNRLSPTSMVQTKDGQAETLIRKYLQDFKDTAYDAMLLKKNGTNAGTVTKLSGNPLVVYRTFWRFENYVKQLLRLPADDFAELRGTSRRFHNCHTIMSFDVKMPVMRRSSPLHWQGLQ